MSEENSPSADPEVLIKSNPGSKSSEGISPEQIHELEEELIKLEADASPIERVAEEVTEEAEAIERLNGEQEDFRQEEEENVEIDEEDIPKTDYQRMADNEGVEEEVVESENILKRYQSTLQDLKEEISRLNKQIDHKARQALPQVTEEDLFKMQALCKYTKIEAKALQAKAEELAQTNQDALENVDALKEESEKGDSNEKSTALREKLENLEREYRELSKPNEINIADLDKVLGPEPNPKFVNEFYVNVQKRTGLLDAENTKLAADIKKCTSDLNKLKENLENSLPRHRQMEDMKARIREFESSYKNYENTEAKLRQHIKQAKEEFSLYSSQPENQHDAESAKNILKEMRNQVEIEETECENLGYVLQDKKNLLRAAQVYGLQRSKTSTKLRTDMELLGSVLVDKEQKGSKLRRAIDEYKIKIAQVQIEIRDIANKKNSAY